MLVSLHVGYLFMSLSSADIFQHYVYFSKYSFRNNRRVSNSLDPDQVQRSVGPDLGPSCLQMLHVPADDKICR